MYFSVARNIEAQLYNVMCAADDAGTCQPNTSTTTQPATSETERCSRSALL